MRVCRSFIFCFSVMSSHLRHHLPLVWPRRQRSLSNSDLHVSHFHLDSWWISRSSPNLHIRCASPSWSLIHPLCPLIHGCCTRMDGCSTNSALHPERITGTIGLISEIGHTSSKAAPYTEIFSTESTYVHLFISI